jgi:hypothetical protein
MTAREIRHWLLVLAYVTGDGHPDDFAHLFIAGGANEAGWGWA